MNIVNYLLSTVATEFIEIMSDKILKGIVLEVQKAKYFGLTVGSTLDIAHIDQLPVVLRYANKEGESVERFLKFIPIHSHGPKDLQNYRKFSSQFEY